MSEATRVLSDGLGISEAPGCWRDSLDSLAALVDRQRRHLAGEAAAPLDEWIPPESPLPPSLLPRVMLLRDETEELATQIQRRVTAAPAPPVSPYA